MRACSEQKFSLRKLEKFETKCPRSRPLKKSASMSLFLLYALNGLPNPTE